MEEFPTSSTTHSLHATGLEEEKKALSREVESGRTRERSLQREMRQLETEIQEMEARATLQQERALNMQRNALIVEVDRCEMLWE